MTDYTQIIKSSGRKKRKLQNQIKKLLEGLRIDPNKVNLHIELGDAYKLLEEPQNAVDHYYAAIDILQKAPNFENVRKQIIGVYQKILEVSPWEPKVLFDLGEQYFATGQKEKATKLLLSSARKASEAGYNELALQFYSQVIKMGKTDLHIVEPYIELCLKLGKKGEAVEHYVYIGDISTQQERYIEALDYYKKANALDPNNPDVMLKIARMYHAIQWIENAAAELVKLGEYYERQEHYSEALKYYQHSVRLDPENERAQQGRQRVTAAYPIDSHWAEPQEGQEPQEPQKAARMQEMQEELDILAELDNIEDSGEEEVGPSQEVQLEGTPIAQRASLTSAISEKPDKYAPDVQEPSSAVSHDSLEESILDLREDDLETFRLEGGLEEMPISSQTPQSLELSPLDLAQFVAQPPQADEISAKTTIQFIPEESLHDLFFQDGEHGEEEPLIQFIEVDGKNEEPSPFQSVGEQIDEEQSSKFRQKIEELEKQLQQAGAEKDILQEQFTQQISQLEAQGKALQQELEDMNKDKAELEEQLQHRVVTPQVSRVSRADSETFDEARYNAIVAKLQHRKLALQEHLNILLKKREENGRLLAEELKTLNTTKTRLQSNLEYIQQIKAQIEKKIKTELSQSKRQIQSLTETSTQLESELRKQQEFEQHLRQEFEALAHEKEELHENYTETINALTKENAKLDQQLQKLSQTKTKFEKVLKKKLYTLNHSYQQLKSEYQAALASKEQELNTTAQQLVESSAKYEELEIMLENIRKERDNLNAMLAQEIETREMLEEKLVSIESQVDEFEIQGKELVDQLGLELDRQSKIEQHVSDEFQTSLEELERLLYLQEQEIQSLEAL